MNYKSGLRILIWPLEVPFFWSQRLALLAKVAIFGPKKMAKQKIPVTILTLKHFHHDALSWLCVNGNPDDCNVHSVPQSAAGLHLSNSPEMSGRGCQFRLISATTSIKTFLNATMSLTIITTSTDCQGWLPSGHQSLGLPRHVSSSGN